MAIIMITEQAELVEIATELAHLISLQNVQAPLARHVQARIQAPHCMAAILPRNQAVPATPTGQNVSLTILQDLMVTGLEMVTSILTWVALHKENKLELTAQSISEAQALVAPTLTLAEGVTTRSFKPNRII